MKKLLFIVVIAVVGFAAYAVFAPSSFAPVAWTPPSGDPPSAADGADTRSLAAATRLAQGVARGPEDVAVDDRGRIYAGYEDGTIRRFDAQGNGGEVYATTNGRPLGLAWAAAPLFDDADMPNRPADEAELTRASGASPAPTAGQTLLVADADQGLLAVGADGDITVLTHAAGDAPFAFTDDVDVASDGAIYFTDASSKYGKNNYRADLLEHGGHGRLLKYDPESRQASVLLDGLQFANGVAVGPDDAYVLVTETGSYRVLRYWLKGDKAGQHDVFIDNLPGFPDGISFNGSDTFWLALFAPRDPILDRVAGYPWIREIVYHLPEILQPQPAHVGHLMGLNTDGRVVRDLIDRRDAAFAPITSVEQAGDQLYLGSLTADSLARLPVPAEPDHQQPGSP
ncbi:SMP-30/gluconolactonase/LRE family protein [Salinisphaera sp. T31B1]|uniref:SMP-30/gluconolactonase/LRE family protein n=1 Tax=Salinisphaera sp. T31B1 TaxID=727963 RepID=UPI00333E5A92